VAKLCGNEKRERIGPVVAWPVGHGAMAGAKRLHRSQIFIAVDTNKRVDSAESGIVCRLPFSTAH